MNPRGLGSSLAELWRVLRQERSHDAPIAADRALSGGIAAAVIAVVVQTLLHAIGEGFGFEFLSANREQNLIAWLHGAAIATAAFMAALVALLGDRGRVRLVLLTGILAFLSLDEVAMIHESVAGSIQSSLGLSSVWDSVLWPIAYAPLGGLLLVLLWGVAREAPLRAAAALRVGLVLLLLAVLAEVLFAPWSTDANLVHVVQGGVEEAAEIAGWILILAGLTALALTRAVDVPGGSAERPSTIAGGSDRD